MYVTLAENDKILSSEVVTNKDNKYHSAFLISTIKEILKSNNLTPKDLDAIGTNIGPGSFTGIRACTTVARMMAQQLDLPAVGISSLDILSKINRQINRQWLPWMQEKTAPTCIMTEKFMVRFN